MYSQHFKLNCRAFAAAPGSQFFVPNDEVNDAVTRLQDVLLSRDAVAIISGGPGVGKTAILEHARSGICDDAVIAWADLRQAEPEQLFDLLILNLGGDTTGGDSALAWHRLHGLIQKHNADGRQVTAAVDVSNITAERAKRLLRLMHMTGEPTGQLNLVLLGPHTLHKLLNVPGLIHLRQRLVFRHRVRPLTEAETAAYLADRIQAAGGDASKILGSDVAGLVHRYVAGVPRLVNTLIEASLTEAANRKLPQLDGEIVQQVARTLGWKSMGNRKAAASKNAPAAAPTATRKKAPSPLELAAQHNAPAEEPQANTTPK
ncbi:MAG TPA: hypothetical protein ENK16_00870, partial [Chromatiales bacterium]|nr:hypothetical protein [Chromatiales bacterium]